MWKSKSLISIGDTGLSPAFGVVFFIVAIILFAYLIHYISKSIQINIYIQNLSKETNLLIEKKDNIIKKDGRISKNTLDSLEKLSNMPSIDIKT